MSTVIDKLLDPAALERVAAAVSRAERGTSGEIVPCIVEQSDEYEESLWLSALLSGGIALVAIALAEIVSDVWGFIGVPMFALVVALASAIGALTAALWPRLRIALAGRPTIDRRTRQTASAAFVAEEVFRTKDRTGILIFLSIREHRVIVVGDTGINALVEQSQWDGVVRTVIEGLRAGKPVEALVDAIRRCGEILNEAGCVLAPGDVNELSDALRIRSGTSSSRTK